MVRARPHVALRTMGAFATVLALMIALPQTAFAAVSATVDPGPSVNGTVYAVAEVGDLTVIGGNFTAVDGYPRQNVAAITAEGEVDPSFNPGVDGSVRALAGSADGGKIFIGGSFTTVAGVPRANLAAVDGAGAVIPDWQADTQSSTSAEVLALARSGDRLYVGGRFGRIDGTWRARLAALNSTTGNVITSFKPAPDWTVRGVAVSADGAKIYAVGGFQTIGGQTRGHGAAELLASTGEATSFDPTTGGGAPLSVALTPDGSRMFFSTPNNNLFAYDPALSNEPVYIVKTGGDTQAIAASASTVYFGGHFSQVSTYKAKRKWIAALNVSDGSLTPWDPKLDGGSMGVWALALTANRLLVGGEFTHVAGKPRKGFVAFSGTP